MSNILTEHRKGKSGICEIIREGLEKEMRKKGVMMHEIERNETK